MNVSYYPGCCMHGTAKGYDQSIQAVSAALDLELIEVDFVFDVDREGVATGGRTSFGFTEDPFVRAEP